MPLCYFAKDEDSQNFVTVEKTFLTSYMAECNEIELKVYLFGLFLCSNTLSRDNSIDHMCDALKLKEEDVKSAFSYWEQMGLVTIFSYDPLQIQYHSIKNRAAYKTYKKEQFADFNAQLEQLFPDKFLMPSNYNAYYEFIESTSIPAEVLIMIIRYCINLKGNNVSSNYILTVARAWINDGIRTIETVEQRIKQYELNTEASRLIANAIGKTSAITIEDRDFYLKWTDSWGFTLDAIIAASKKTMKTMQKLDSALDECFRNSAMSALEIETYFKNKKKLVENAIRIANLLGVWYDNPAPLVENYITPWTQNGYTIDGLTNIATYCFKNSLKKFEQMDDIVNTLFKLGIVTDSAIEDYFNKLQLADANIKQILDAICTSRVVTIRDRDMYKVWTEDWNFDLPTILYVASTCVGKSLGNIATKLSILKENGIKDKDGAAKFFTAPKQSTAAQNFNANDRAIADQKLGESLLNENEIDEVDV